MSKAVISQFPLNQNNDFDGLMATNYNGRRKGQFASRQSLRAQHEALLAPVSKFRKEWVYPTALNGVSSNGYKVLKWVKVEATEDEEEIRMNAQAAGEKSSGLASLEEDAATPGQAQGTPAVVDIATPPATSVNNPVVPPSVTHPLAQGVTIPPEMDPAKPAQKEMEEIQHEEHPNEPTPDVVMGEATQQGSVDVPMSHQQEASVAVALDERTLN